MPVLLFKVHGMVQGVGYRWFTHKVATHLGVTGYVRNLPDGSVEVVAQADQDVLARFEQQLRRGPSMSEVAAVERSELDGDARFRSFDIRF